MNNFTKGLAVVALLATAFIASCGDHGSPTDQGLFQRSTFRAPSECGEAAYLAALSPVLAAWEDSIETWRGNTSLLNETPAYTGQSTAAYLGSLVPVLEQWETAINAALDSAVVDTVASFNPDSTPRQAYLTGLSSLLASWESDLDAFRGRDFLATAPVFQADETAPEIVCNGDTTIACAPDSGVVFEFEATATDDCVGEVAVTCDPPSGSRFAVGQTLVTCTAVDSVGNEATCTFTVTVEEAEPPVIVSANASPNTLWPPNHRWVDVALDVDAESDCGEVTWTVTEVTSNDTDHGAGNTDPDWIIGDDGSLKLRAERSGQGSGRTYTVHFVVEDAVGNTTAGTVDVECPHDQGGGKK